MSGTIGFKIHNNRVHHGAKEGIDCKDASINGLVYDNEIDHMGKVGLYFNHCQNTKMYRNNVHHNGTTGVLWAVGDDATGAQITSNNELYQNLVWENGWGGYGGGLGVMFYRAGSQGTLQNNKIYNNVFYHSQWECIGNNGVPTTAFSGNIFRNNICMKNGGGTDGSFSNNTLSHNLFYSNGGTTLGSNNVLADPKFVDPLIGNFTLNSGSPAIDKGYNMGLVFNGTTPDIGRWEFGTVIVPIPVDAGTPVPDVYIKPDVGCMCPCACLSVNHLTMKDKPVSGPVSSTKLVSTDSTEQDSVWYLLPGYLVIVLVLGIVFVMSLAMSMTWIIRVKTAKSLKKLLDETNQVE
jgi:hypothetical protein